MLRKLLTLTLLSGLPLVAAGPAHAGPLGGPTPSAPTESRAFIAKVVVPTKARSKPGAGRVVARLRTEAAIYGGSNQLLVLKRKRVRGQEYLLVRLPQRPNDAAGWISSDFVRVHATPWRVVIDISERRLSLLRAGRVEANSSAIVGTASTPTPTGLFAVSEIVPQPRGGNLGPFVIALTAHSNVHRTFDGGDGRVGLHSYEQLGAPLGTASSNGCVRLPTSIVRRLVRDVEPGVPVLVTD